MVRVKLDEIDRRILRDLQNEGRITNVEIASRAGISAPPCLRRVRALEQTGYIEGYHADLNGQALGFGVTVFAQVGLNSQAETDLVAFEELIEGWPMVRECYMLASCELTPGGLHSEYSPFFIPKKDTSRLQQPCIEARL